MLGERYREDERQRIDALLRRLWLPFGDGGRRAERELASIGPAAVEPLEAAMDRAVDAGKRASLALVLVCIGAYFLAGLFVIPETAPFMVPLLVVSLALLRIVPRRRYAALLRVLLQIDDPRTARPLLAVLPNLGMGPARMEVRRRLAFLLPRLAPEHAALLERRHRETLYGYVYGFAVRQGQRPTDDDAEFSIAAIKGLVQIGDQEALPALRTVAKNGWNELLRDVARLGVAELERRAAPVAARPPLPVARPEAERAAEAAREVRRQDNLLR